MTYNTPDWPALPPLSALTNRVHCMDALELLALLPDASADLILTDLPYGAEKTKATWDNRLPMEPLWDGMRRGCIALFAAQPFSSALIQTEPGLYRYSWYYEKPRGSNFGNSNCQPLRVIEETLIFSHCVASANQFTDADDLMIYHPPLVRLERPYTRTDKPHHKRIANPSVSSHVHNPEQRREKNYQFATPTNLFYAAMDNDPDRGLHPTQKPTVICEYLIETYTEPDAVVVDFCCGSGTTALAARNTGRRFIAGDTSPEYVAIAEKRLAQPYTIPMFAAVSP